MSIHPLLKSERRSAYILLTVNRPNSLNALNAEIFQALEKFFSTEYAKYKPLRGIIITGEGDRSFVAGADIAELVALDPSGAKTLVDRGHRTFDLIENFHLPVIAAVNGFALGGGCELAMACHLRLASPNAKFGLPELGLGILPGYGGTQRLTRYLGRTKALEMMLTSKMINAKEALDMGLINTIVKGEDLIGSCQSMLDTISSKGPQAVRAAIQAVNAYDDPGVNGYEVEKKLFIRLVGKEEAKEGFNAFLEKRKPNFKD